MKVTTRYSSRYNVLKGYQVSSGKKKKNFMGWGSKYRAEVLVNIFLKEGRSNVVMKPLYGKGKYVKVTLSNKRRRRKK